MKKLLLQLLAGVVGLGIAILTLPSVQFQGPWYAFLAAGLLLGFLNYFVKPLLNLITLPLRILTLGLVGLLINILLVWAIDIVFPELVIAGIMSLALTTATVWVVSKAFAMA